MGGLGPVELLFSVMLLAVPFVLVFLGIRFLRAQERLWVDPDEIARLTARVDSLDEQLEGIRGTLEQIAEGQRFTTAVLAEPAGTPEAAE